MALRVGFIVLIMKKDQTENRFLTYDGKTYENGLPDMKWEAGQVKE